MLVFMLIPITLIVIAWFAYFAVDYFQGFISFLCACIFLSALACALFTAIVLPFYYGAGLKADLINSEYGTNYTREQMFFASDVIDTVREIKRQRVELNGNLMQQEIKP